MQRLLIANRGEIALRIVRTARELGLATLAVHTPEDQELASGYGADELVALPGRGASAYLDVEMWVGLARAERCDALHPGYGFSSESPELARACEAQGIAFVGSSAATLERFGDKAAARRLASELDIPIVQGSSNAISLDGARDFFESLPAGSAMMLKAVAGGGGRGMRAVRRLGEIEEAFERCHSEALRAFGSGALFAERLLEGVRHIEIQVVADAYGAITHLWDRDCSLQRRYQKLVEIAPAPSLDPGLRSQLIEASLALANAADFRGVGTFEFLVEPTGESYFMEANPRLQVEHTVTEEVTGIDLVEVQLRIAAGATLAELGLVDPPAPRGCAIELRILAESMDDAGEVRPSGGRIDVFRMPGGPGIRVDTAMREGLSLDPSFDSLVAKLIVSCSDPDHARVVRRARRALSEVRIAGPATNLGLLAALLDRDEFSEHALTTQFVHDHVATLLAAAGDLTEVRADRAPESRGGSSSTPPDGIDVLRAPLIATLVEVCVAEGALVHAGQALCILDSMKMEHVVAAQTAGRMERVFVSAGDVVAEGDPLAWIRPAEGGVLEQAAATEVDPALIRPDLAEVQARNALLLDESRPEAVARRRERGQRTARENLRDLCDPDSFIEYGGLAVAAQRRARPLEELRRRTPADAIITGFATINADCFGSERARCAVLLVDATVLAGTQGFNHHRKIDRMLELAERNAAPVVFFPEGGGGRPNDTDVGDISVAGLNITSFHAFARLSGKVPRVSVVSGFCFAGSAAIAGCADVIIATRGASLGMGGPAMIEGGGLGVHLPEDVGPTSVLEPNGVIDLLVENEEEAVVVARRYLSYFQGKTEDWSCADQRRLRHLVPENRRRVYDVRRVIDVLCDEGSVLELRRAFATGMITALVRVEGRPMGLIANDPTHLGGAIDDSGAEKAARFLQLCDAFGLPVLSLCDTPGFMVGPEIEARAHVRKAARLFVAGAGLSVPLFLVILRKGYGLGAQAMAGGSFVAPLFSVAWPTGEIGGMGLEGAVNLGFRKQLDALPEAERSALFDKLVAAMYEKGKALNAASQLEFDAVIDPAETRARIVRGLEAAGPASPGSHRPIDTW